MKTEVDLDAIENLIIAMKQLNKAMQESTDQFVRFTRAYMEAAVDEVR
jgi:hypothetical protein